MWYIAMYNICTCHASITKAVMPNLLASLIQRITMKTCDDRLTLIETETQHVVFNSFPHFCGRNITLNDAVSNKSLDPLINSSSNVSRYKPACYYI